MSKAEYPIEHTPAPDEAEVSSGFSAPVAWDVSALADALGVPAERRVDALFGVGTAYRVGASQDTQLEIFPAAGAVRLTSADLQLALFEQGQAPTIGTDAIVFDAASDRQRRRLRVSVAGEIALVITNDPTQGPKMPPDASRIAERPELLVAPDTMATAAPVTPEPPSSQPSPAADPAGQPRIEFAGRLGRDPRCRTTSREIRVCTFPLAEKREAAEPPTWLTVVAFKALAAKVEATLKKGMFVDGVGYQHEKVRKARDGTTRTETEIYAVVITPR